ncbi:MAG: 4-(cytidine 5'-diphospho)-2-C-methyl-D-erythritol kinase [Rhodobacteraceae bacterium]|nr:4-(cytidine 5'-diphospho)-2-C-methyl-D-erythritol kinase [Paracoccaceae bacterium]
MVEAFAPAKLNLALHVVGRRDDGMHLVDSLVAFADVGDRLTAATAGALALSVGGPAASGCPADASNLVWRAARTLDPAAGARITLHKELPAAAGLGGGSADAAAALRALALLWGRPGPAPAAVLALGADVPVCLAARTARMGGIGEVLGRAPRLPRAFVVLVNPGVGLATGAVFAALARRDNPPMAATLPRFADTARLARFLRGCRNDLEAPAAALVPAVGAALAALAARPGCLLARMSGSGATVFGLFADPGPAEDAALALARPGWWVRAAALLPDPGPRVAPRYAARATT